MTKKIPLHRSFWSPWWRYTRLYIVSYDTFFFGRRKVFVVVLLLLQKIALLFGISLLLAIRNHGYSSSGPQGHGSAAIGFVRLNNIISASLLFTVARGRSCSSTAIGVTGPRGFERVLLLWKLCFLCISSSCIIVCSTII